MLLDCASTPAKVRYSVGWSWLSLNSRESARQMRLGTSTTVEGVTTPSSSAAAAVMTLAVEPGS